MSKLQRNFARVLRDKKRRIAVPIETLKNWERMDTSPSLVTFEKVCAANDIELPFFFDGNIAELSSYLKKVGEKVGLKITVNCESL